MTWNIDLTRCYYCPKTAEVTAKWPTSVLPWCKRLCKVCAEKLQETDEIVIVTEGVEYKPFTVD